MAKGTVTLDEETLGVLRESFIGDTLLKLPDRALDRALYMKVAKAIESAGGKWNRGQKAFVFALDPRKAIPQLLDAGGYVDKKKAFAYFPTPDAICDLLVSKAELGELDPDERILEPSAGDGAIVRAIRRAGFRQHVTAVEIDKSHRDKLVASKPSRIVWNDFLTVSLKAHPDEIPGSAAAGFDAIIANPPFGNGLDARHVLRMYELLSPGGRIVAVMAHSVDFRIDGWYRKLASMVSMDIEPLPPRSFCASGTDVGTCVVVIDK